MNNTKPDTKKNTKTTENYSENYYKIRHEIESEWPASKVSTFNANFAVSAHAKKIVK